MSGERRSLQDRIRKRQQGSFVGRQGQLIQYRHNFALPVDDERRQFLFNVHGDAGVGKTFLTRQLRQIADTAGAVTAYIDETSEDVTSAMAAIAEEFCRAGCKLADFEKRLADYRQRRQELESDPKAPASIASFLTRTGVIIGLAAARDIPLAGSLLEPVDAAASADQVNQVREYVVRKFSDHRDVRLVLSPADELTPTFVAGLNRVATTRPVALFFDTYERTAAVLGGWLHGLYSGRYGDLPETLITTISGQKPLDPNLWSEFLPVITDIALEPFSEAEARQLLSGHGITDEATTQVIMNLSGRLPLWLATLADARSQGKADIGDPSGNAVERFLRWEGDPARRRTAIAAALPRTVNRDVLGVIAPGDELHEMFSWLCGLPFVSQRGDTWAYHNVVRAAMLRLRRAEAPAAWRADQQSLARAYAEWAIEEAQGAADSWTSQSWVDYTREESYHLLCADPHGNLRTALLLAVKAAAQGAVRARQWATLIADAGHDANSEEVREWGQRLTNALDDDDLAPYFTCLINSTMLDTASLAMAHKRRPFARQAPGLSDEVLAEALADFGRAVELDPGDAEAVAYRGATYRLMHRYDEAVADLDRSIELEPGKAEALAFRGITYAEMGRYDEALADLNRSIELNPGDAWTFAYRGLTYAEMGRDDDAVADYTHALEVDPTLADVVGHRSLTYSTMGRYDEALAGYSRALELGPSNPAENFLYRGMVYHQIERLEEALADYSRSIELSPGDTQAICFRGLTYKEMGRLNEALADLNRAIELNPSDAWTVSLRGSILMEMGRLNEALADLNRAVELDPGNAADIGTRGLVHQKMGRSDEALADYSHALSLDPALAWVSGRRGETYRDMQRYDEALADLNRALDLDATLSWAFGLRGVTYQDMERYDEALADLSRALYLDPQSAWVAECRGEIYKNMERFDEALADFDRSIELGSGDARVFALRGDTYRRVKRFEEALADLGRSIELDVSLAWAVGVRGDVYRKMERYDEAMADLNRAIELDPSQGWAFGLRGATYRDMERYDEALADLNRAIELDPDDDKYAAERAKIHRLMARGRYMACAVPELRARV